MNIEPVRKEAQADHVTLIERRISDQEFADFANAADLILLPYRQITGSGALLAALTFGRAVVASDLPYFRNILTTDTAAGVLVPLEDVDALAAGITRCLSIPANEREAAAKALCREYAWERVVGPVAATMQSLCGRQDLTSPGTAPSLTESPTYRGVNQQSRPASTTPQP